MELQNKVLYTLIFFIIHIPTHANNSKNIYISPIYDGCLIIQDEMAIYACYNNNNDYDDSDDDDDDNPTPTITAFFLRLYYHCLCFAE